MAREIFTNAAVTRLAQSLSDSELVLTVEDTTNFPVPVVGDEFFSLTVSGACNNTVEVMRAVEICGPNCIRVDTRGYQGTTATAFSPGDLSYHALTANAAQIIMDRFQWFLGPFDTPPPTDNEGFPLQEGHIYYDTTLDTMFVWNGTIWAPFNPTIGATIVETFTWVAPPGGYAGKSAGDWIDGTNAILMYLNGSRLVEEHTPGTLLADYVVHYDTNEIEINQTIAEDDVLQAEVLLGSDPDDLSDYIQRTEVDASAYAFVDSDTNPASPSGLVLVPQDVIFSATDGIKGRVRWKSTWSAQAYAKHDMVMDNGYVAIANAVTTATDRPGLVDKNAPEYATEGATMVDLTAGVTTGQVENQYTMNVPGKFYAFKIHAMDPLLVTSYDFTLLVNDVVKYERKNNNVILDVDAQFEIPAVIVVSGDVVRAQIAYTGTETSQHVGYWTANTPAWASLAEGDLEEDGVPAVGEELNAYGVDIYFQEFEDPPSALWDLLPTSGGTGVGGGTGGGGPLHTISTVAPVDSQGNDGDIWFVKL
jgi:hypothetical protein